MLTPLVQRPRVQPGLHRGCLGDTPKGLANTGNFCANFGATPGQFVKAGVWCGDLQFSESDGTVVEAELDFF